MDGFLCKERKGCTAYQGKSSEKTLIKHGDRPFLFSCITMNTEKLLYFLSRNNRLNGFLDYRGVSLYRFESGLAIH